MSDDAPTSSSDVGSSLIAEMEDSDSPPSSSGAGSSLIAEMEDSDSSVAYRTSSSSSSEMISSVSVSSVSMAAIVLSSAGNWLSSDISGSASSVDSYETRPVSTRTSICGSCSSSDVISPVWYKVSSVSSSAMTENPKIDPAITIAIIIHSNCFVALLFIAASFHIFAANGVLRYSNFRPSSKRKWCFHQLLLSILCCLIRQLSLLL